MLWLHILLSFSFCIKTLGMWPFKMEAESSTNSRSTRRRGYIPMNSLTYQALQNHPQNSDSLRLNLQALINHNKLRKPQSPFHLDQDDVSKLRTQYAYNKVETQKKGGLILNQVKKNSRIENTMSSAKYPLPNLPANARKYIPFTFFFDNRAVAQKNTESQPTDGILEKLNSYVYKTVESYFQKDSNRVPNIFEDKYPEFIKDIKSPVRVEGPTFYIPLDKILEQSDIPSDDARYTNDPNDDSSADEIRRVFQSLNQQKDNNGLFGFIQGGDEVSLQELQGKSSHYAGNRYTNLPDSPIIWVFTTKKYDVDGISTTTSSYYPVSPLSDNPTSEIYQKSTEITTEDPIIFKVPGEGLIKTTTLDVLETDVPVEITTSIVSTEGLDKTPIPPEMKSEEMTEEATTEITTTDSSDYAFSEHTSGNDGGTEFINSLVKEETDSTTKSPSVEEEKSSFSVPDIYSTTEANFKKNDGTALFANNGETAMKPTSSVHIEKSHELQTAGKSGPIVQVNVWNYINGHLQLTGTQNFPPSIIPYITGITNTNKSIEVPPVIPNEKKEDASVNSNSTDSMKNLFAFVTNQVAPSEAAPTYSSKFSGKGNTTVHPIRPTPVKTLEESKNTSIILGLYNYSNNKDTGALPESTHTSTSEVPLRTIFQQTTEASVEKSKPIFNIINHQSHNTNINTNQMSISEQLININKLVQPTTDSNSSSELATKTTKCTNKCLEKTPVLNIQPYFIDNKVGKIPNVTDELDLAKTTTTTKPEESLEQAFLNRIGTKELLKQYVQRVVIFSDLLKNSNRPQEELNKLIEDLALQSLLSHYLEDISQDKSSESEREETQKSPITTHTQKPPTSSRRPPMSQEVEKPNENFLTNILSLYKNIGQNSGMRPQSTLEKVLTNQYNDGTMTHFESPQTQFIHLEQSPLVVTDQMVPTRQTTTTAESGDLRATLGNLIPQGTSFQECLRAPACAFALAASLAVGATAPILTAFGRRKRSVPSENRIPFPDEFQHLLSYLENFNETIDSRVSLKQQKNLIHEIRSLYNKIID